MAENDDKKIPEHIADIDRLTRTELRRKYGREYNSWRNRKQHTKGTSHWSPEFEDFRDFLRHMGPAQPGQTLDRRNNSDPRYGPGLCEWNDKRGQANNRHTTWRVHSDGGEVPISEFAREAGLDPRPLRRAMRASNPYGPNPLAFKPWPAHRADWWERQYLQSAFRTTYRYDYLILNLARGVAELERWFAEREDIRDIDDAARRDEYLAKGALQRRMTEALVAARIARDEWAPVAWAYMRRYPDLGPDGRRRTWDEED